jgi:hypothetical protein
MPSTSWIGDTDGTLLTLDSGKIWGISQNGMVVRGDITAARKAMRKQTAPKGTILNLNPKYLIIPAALEGIAVQITNPINLAATASSACYRAPIDIWLENIIKIEVRGQYPVFDWVPGRPKAMTVILPIDDS